MNDERDSLLMAEEVCEGEMDNRRGANFSNGQESCGGRCLEAQSERKG